MIAFHKHRGYWAFGFEVNQFQEFVASELVRRSRQAGHPVPVMELSHTKDKHGRIQRLQPYLASGHIRLCRRHVTLQDQLRQYPHAAHDDGPDALEMLMNVASEASEAASRPRTRIGQFTDQGIWWHTSF